MPEKAGRIRADFWRLEPQAPMLTKVPVAQAQHGLSFGGRAQIMNFAPKTKYETKFFRRLSLSR